LGGDILGRVERSIVIKAPPEKVWEMLAFDRFPEWMDMMKRVEYTSNVKTPKDKYRVGATAHGIPEGYEEFNCNFEITESLENEKMTHRLWEKVYRGTLGGLITYTLESVEAGTRFTYEVNLNEIPWGILGKIISPLWQRMGRKEYEKTLENLKSILEK
jgi:uncharacterized protein YndB with AHSA1/START domain